MLSINTVNNILELAMSKGCDFAEIYEENVLSSNLSLVDGNVDNIVSGRSYGVGIRIIKDLNCVYAYTTDNSLNSLLLTTKRITKLLDNLNKQDITFDINLCERLNTKAC